jgi:ABC-2 type transport system ATP-binding protein
MIGRNSALQSANISKKHKNVAILSIKNVRKQYRQHTALSGVSLDVPKGSIYGLLGPNGAGKTTLIRIITQIILPDEGEIHFDGSPLQPLHREKIGYLPEERGLYKKMQVGEQLFYLAQLRGLSHSQAKTQIDKWVEKFKMQDWLKRKVADLSKGMQQKVQFVATVLHQPPLLILDEPFSGFDPINANIIQQEILELKRQGTTIIFSTHRMESVEELCDSIALIHQSQKIIEGEKNHIKNQFKTHTFALQTQEPFSLSATQEAHFSIQKPSAWNAQGYYETHIQLQESSSNQLLAYALEQHNVLGLREILPSMNDIFLHLTQEKAV